MSRKYNKQMFIYVLSLTLLITFGSSFQNKNQPISYAASISVDSFELLKQAMSVPRSPAPKVISSPKLDYKISHADETAQVVKVKAELHMASYMPIKPQIAAVEKKKTNTYEVTAHFLNVRAKPSGKAEILNVVKQGDLLEALETTDNGWLEIKDQGYVHASYTKQVEHAGVTKKVEHAGVTKKVEHAGVVSQKVKHPAPIFIKKELGKPSSEVKSDSGLTEDHISTIFKGTALEDEGLEEVILEIEQEYGINAFFTIAVLKLESGNGKSRLAQSKNNLFGLNAIDGAIHKAFSFKTKGDSVRKFGQLISKNYVGKGYTTIEKVATKYCPSNDDWPALVTKIMKGDYKKL